MVRDRTYEELARRLGPVSDAIAAAIERNGTAATLEIGAGVGLVMHQLHMMFGRRLEPFGLNRRRHHGDHRQCIEEGLNAGVFDETVRHFYERHTAPAYVCADAGKAIPVADESFDFVYSQATIPFVADKANLIREVHRILRPGGSARLQVNLRPKFMLGDTDSLFRIRRAGTVQSIEDYVGEVNELTAELSPGGVGYIGVDKSQEMELGLSLVSIKEVGDPDCPYIESTYEVSGSA